MCFRKMITCISAIAAAALLFAGTVMAEGGTGETYISELTGEPISAALKDQRPVAVIVDNESIAYPHYGTADGDVVYEVMNSTANGHITRLMVLVKDWEKITRIGNIRSCRPTNIMLAGEWNAVLCHDGGPFYVDAYFAQDYAKDHFSGTFSRVNNGKSYEFTEYCLSGDLDSNFANTGVSKNYTSFAPEGNRHFRFMTYGTEKEMSAALGTYEAQTVTLPFEHNSSTLKYNAETRTYDYYCYGSLHTDAETGKVMTFKNALVLKCPYTLYDANGYMVYNLVQQKQPGYYFCNGYAQPITWTKDSENGVTRYYDIEDDELALNTGKVYICIVPDDKWDSLAIS